MKKKIIHKNIANVYDLSPLQKGILYNYFSNKKSNDYIVQNVFDITGNIQVNFILQALKLLFHRYDILRTKILFEEVSNPLQVVFQSVEPEFSETSLLDIPKDMRETKYQDILKQEIERGFDLQKDLLLRVRLIRYDEGVTRIVWNYHHIILDGWSVSKIYATFLEYYDLLCENNSYEEILNEIQVERKKHSDYKDYIEWLTGRNQSEDMEYWAEYLNGYEGTTQLLPMTKHIYTGSETESLLKVSVSKEESEKALSFAEKHNVTLNSLLLAVWGIYLQKVNYSDDVVFGKVVSGRNVPENQVKGITDIVGLIANTVPVRVKCEKDTTILDLIKQINHQSIEEGEHHCSSLAEIQSLTKQKSGLVNTLYVLENFNLDTEAWKQKHLEIQAASYREQTNYDISTIISVEDEQLHLAIRYNPGVFVKEDIKKILNTFHRMLCYAVEHPKLCVSTLPSVSEKEKQNILKKCSNTKKTTSNDLTVIQMFEKRVEEKGSSTAIRCGNKRLSYSELNGFSNQISKLLRLSDVKPDELIPLLCRRGPELIIGILGTLKAGAAYIPIDVEQPEERIKYILENSGCKTILTDGSYENIKLNEKVKIIDLRKVWEMEGIMDNPSPVGSEENLAYCIYTSGTSGVPKGVLIEKRNLTNYMHHAYENYVKDTPVIPLFSNCAFDLTVTSIFLPLICGGEMVIYPEHTIDALTDIFTSKEYTLIKLTPTQLKIALSLEQTSRLANLETLILGGEALVTADAQNCLTKFGEHISIHNEYGPTEATVGCCDYIYNPVYDAEETVSIGKPIADTSIYILKDNELCEIGVKGELCIAGAGIARGYTGSENGKKFVKNPFGKGRMYRSGDIAKLNDDGNLTYLGRLDEQLKVRGYRIEPDEIAAALKSTGMVTDAAVTLETDRFGNAGIYAYYVSNKNIDSDTVRTLLQNKLPAYMIPAGMMQIEEMPLAPSGKIDKSALPKFKKENSEHQKAGNEFEEKVLEVWQAVLGIQDFGIYDNFFEIGGNSLLIMKMINLLSKTYPNMLRAGDVFANPTVYLMARCLKQMQGGLLTCEKIVFPVSFYRNGRPIKQRRLSVKFDDALTQTVLASEQETFSYILFSYCYILFECTQNQNFSICVKKENQYFVIQLTKDDFQDLNRLPQIILEKYRKAEKYDQPAIRFDEKNNGLFPIFTYNSKKPYEHNMMADFEFSINVKKEGIQLKVELVNKDIATESAVWLLEEFQAVLEEVYRKE